VQREKYMSAYAKACISTGEMLGTYYNMDNACNLTNAEQGNMLHRRLSLQIEHDTQF
jgi:hypothetical protein